MNQIHFQKLQNGLKVCLLSNPFQNTVATYLRGIVGSNYEKNNQIGAAHLVEHWLINTKKQKKLLNDITANGGRYFGVTSRDDVLFAVQSRKEDVKKALNCLYGIFAGVDYDSNEFENVKKLVYPEIIRKFDNPEKLIGIHAMHNLYRNQRLGKLNIGSVKDIKNVTKAKVKEFYDSYYSPERFVLVVSGNFNTQKIDTYINEIFSKINNKTVKPYEIEFKTTSAYKKINLDKKFNQHYIRWDYQGPKFLDSSKYSLELAAKILSVQLKTNLQREGLAYKTSVDLLTSRNYGIFSIFAATPLNNSERVLANIELCVQNLKNNIAELHLLRAKKSVITNILFALDTPYLKADYYSELHLHSKSANSHTTEIKKLNSVTLQNTKKTVENLLSQKPNITMI